MIASSDTLFVPPVLSSLGQVAVITKQITNRPQFKSGGEGYFGEDAGHTHPESFPASAQHGFVETMPRGPSWFYPAAVL